MASERGDPLVSSGLNDLLFERLCPMYYYREH
jgi:hypothetical protein